MGIDSQSSDGQPQAPPFDAHCRRVAAWSVELARARGLEEKQQRQLEQAALCHHNLLAILQGEKRAAFLADLGVSESDPNPQPVIETEILELANALDEHFEWEPFSDRSEEDLNPAASAAFECLRCVTEKDLENALRRLPVFPAAAQKTLDVIMREDWNVYDLRVVASGDQVLAAELMGAANSWVFAPRQPIHTLAHAISYMGADHSSKILLAASIKPLFASPKLREIWNHALEASAAAQAIARLSGRVNPEEAFLAGLVHDIGRLAMAILPTEFQRRASALLEKGCELMLVERVLCGTSHAELGASGLKNWAFPEQLVEGVRYHHEPELTASHLAAVLYLAERMTNPWEDLPSLARSKAALDRVGLETEKLSDRELARDSKLECLRFPR